MSKKYNSSLYFYPNCVVFRKVLLKKHFKSASVFFLLRLDEGYFVAVL